MIYSLNIVTGFALGLSEFRWTLTWLQKGKRVGRKTDSDGVKKLKVREWKEIMDRVKKIQNKIKEVYSYTCKKREKSEKTATVNRHRGCAAPVRSTGTLGLEWANTPPKNHQHTGGQNHQPAIGNVVVKRFHIWWGAWDYPGKGAAQNPTWQINRQTITITCFQPLFDKAP